MPAPGAIAATTRPRSARSRRLERCSASRWRGGDPNLQSRRRPASSPTRPAPLAGGGPFPSAAAAPEMRHNRDWRWARENRGRLAPNRCVGPGPNDPRSFPQTPERPDNRCRPAAPGSAAGSRGLGPALLGRRPARHLARQPQVQRLGQLQFAGRQFVLQLGGRRPVLRPSARQVIHDQRVLGDGHQANRPVALETDPNPARHAAMRQRLQTGRRQAVNLRRRRGAGQHHRQLGRRHRPDRELLRRRLLQHQEQLRAFRLQRTDANPRQGTVHVVAARAAGHPRLDQGEFDVQTLEQPRPSLRLVVLLVQRRARAENQPRTPEAMAWKASKRI